MFRTLGAASIIAGLVFSAPAQAQKANAWEQVVQDQIIEASGDLAVVAADMGFTAEVLDYYDGTIDAGANNTVNFPTYPGRTYAIIAACDQDCNDIDLVVQDQYNNTVDSDRETNALPIVIFEAARGIQYHYHAEMYNCQTSFCYYGAALYELR